MNNEDRKIRVEEIFDTIKNLNEELSKIKKECPHDSYQIGNWSWRIGCIDQVKICDHCFDNIGMPSDEEHKKFIDDGAGYLSYDGNEDMKT